MSCTTTLTVLRLVTTERFALGVIYGKIDFSVYTIELGKTNGIRYSSLLRLEPSPESTVPSRLPWSNHLQSESSLFSAQSREGCFGRLPKMIAIWIGRANDGKSDRDAQPNSDRQLKSHLSEKGEAPYQY